MPFIVLKCTQNGQKRSIFLTNSSRGGSMATAAPMASPRPHHAEQLPVWKSVADASDSLNFGDAVTDMKNADEGQGSGEL